MKGLRGLRGLLHWHQQGAHAVLLLLLLRRVLQVLRALLRLPLQTLLRREVRCSWWRPRGSGASLGRGNAVRNGLHPHRWSVADILR